MTSEVCEHFAIPHASRKVLPTILYGPQLILLD